MAPFPNSRIELDTQPTMKEPIPQTANDPSQPQIAPPSEMSPEAMRAELRFRGVETHNNCDRVELEQAVVLARKNSIENRAVEALWGTSTSLNPRNNDGHPQNQKQLKQRHHHRNREAAASGTQVIRSTSKESLTFSNHIAPQVLHMIRVSKMTSLISLDFDKRLIGDGEVSNLADALMTNTTVKKLSLKQCQVSDLGVTKLSECLCNKNSLQILHLDDNLITKDGALTLSTTLITNETLTVLTLNNNIGIGNDGVLYLCGALEHNTKLLTLEVKGCGVASDHSRIQQMLSLLSERQIDADFQSLVKRLLDDDFRVTGIDLSGRHLGDAGLARLADALVDNTQVRQVWLRGCSIGDSGAKILASCLEQNMAIVDLFLGGNDIRNEGCIAISNALALSNSTLVSLEMDDNKVEDVAIIHFIDALEKNNSVLVASFHNNSSNEHENLHRLETKLAERRNGLNLISFVVDPDNSSVTESCASDRKGVVDMSICSSYLPSTYRRAGFHSVADSTKCSESRSKSVYYQNSKNFSNQCSGIKARNYRIPPPPPPLPPPPLQSTFLQGNKNHSPPKSKSVITDTLLRPGSEEIAKGSQKENIEILSTQVTPMLPTVTEERHRSLTYQDTRREVSPIAASKTNLEPLSTEIIHSRPPYIRCISSNSANVKLKGAPACNPRDNTDIETGTHNLMSSESKQCPPSPPALQFKPSSNKPQVQVLRRASSCPTGKNLIMSSNQLTCNKHYLTPVLERSEAVTLTKNTEVSELRATAGPMKPSAQEKVDKIKEWSVHTPQEALNSTVNESLTSQHSTMYKLYCQVEMMRCMNYLAALHYRSKHLWLCFLPTSLSIFLTGVLSLASVIDISGSGRLVLSLCTVFFALISFILNFFQSSVGWISRSQVHRSAALQLADIGIRLESLCNNDLSSSSHTSLAHTAYKVNSFLQAMKKCAPEIPKPINEAFDLTLSRMRELCAKPPRAVQARLDDYCGEGTRDDKFHVPINMQLDALDLLRDEITRSHAFPLFLPQGKKVATRTINIFFMRPVRSKQGINDISTLRSERRLQKVYNYNEDNT